LQSNFLPRSHAGSGIASLIYPSGLPERERLRRLTLRAHGELVLGALLLWPIALVVAGEVTLSPAALSAVQAVYCGVLAAYGCIRLAGLGGELPRALAWMLVGGGAIGLVATLWQ
jgi:hypothetical protein